MKLLKQHIYETLKIGKNLSGWSTYTYQPKTKKELKQMIKDRISKEGSNCNLNDIDTSLIEDMSWLFFDVEFNGDISMWNVSNVKNMIRMFSRSNFNGDISNWNIYNVESMNDMFVTQNSIKISPTGKSTRTVTHSLCFMNVLLKMSTNQKSLHK